MQLTEAAAQRVQELLDKRGKPSVGIRIGVRTKGCSGLSYTLEYADKKGPADEVVEQHGVTVLIDPKATMFILGTEMDYVEEKLQIRLRLPQSEREGSLRLRRILPRLNAPAVAAAARSSQRRFDNRTTGSSVAGPVMGRWPGGSVLPHLRGGAAAGNSIILPASASTAHFEVDGAELDRRYFGFQRNLHPDRFARQVGQGARHRRKPVGQPEPGL